MPSRNAVLDKSSRRHFDPLMDCMYYKVTCCNYEGHLITVTPYTIILINSLEIDKYRHLKFCNLFLSLRCAGILPVPNADKPLPLISQTYSLPLRIALLHSLCHAYGNHTFSHKEVNEENNVLKLVSKQKVKKLEEDPRNMPSVRRTGLNWSEEDQQTKKILSIRRNKW